MILEKIFEGEDIGKKRFHDSPITGGEILKHLKCGFSTKTNSAPAMGGDRCCRMVILVRRRNLPDVGLSEDVGIFMSGEGVYFVVRGSCHEMSYAGELEILFRMFGENTCSNGVKACHPSSGYIPIAGVEEHHRMAIFLERRCDLTYPEVSTGKEDSVRGRGSDTQRKSEAPCTQAIKEHRSDDNNEHCWDHLRCLVCNFR